MLLDFGKSGYLRKAKSQPDKVRQVVDKVKTEGIAQTLNAVKSKLDQPMPLGYCNVGSITKVQGAGFKVHGLKVGDKVVSNGPHAEIVSVPYNLCAKVPDDVSDEEAPFAVIGAIGLQGIRLAQPTLGECFTVTGLGLVGQMTVQLLIANGCRVLGIDLDSNKCRIAEQFGAETVDLSKGEDPIEKTMAFSRGNGVDGVLITAATKSNEPVHQAAKMCRKKGRIVLVGVTGLELSRADFYEKELSFQVSCSYGPGRYDPHYEEKGHDYPIGYVRWTEKRNFEAVLDMMAAGKLNVKPLISHRFPFEEAEKAYELISENKEPYLGIILEYGSTDEQNQKNINPQITHPPASPERLAMAGVGFSQINNRTIELKDSSKGLISKTGAPVIGLIGAGNFAGQVLLPAIAKNDVRLKSIASGGGVTGTHLGKKFGFELSTTDTNSIFNDPDINTVFITTRHNSHAKYVIKGLKTGKHIFVEKPLCLNNTELGQIVKSLNSQIVKNDLKTDNTNQQTNYLTNTPILILGFNRRFAPHVTKMKELLNTVSEPKSMVMTVNAGAIPADHWTQDPEVGGGRVIGEACHFIDLLRFLSGNQIVKHEAISMASESGDTLTIQLSFKDGSIGTIHYFANGTKRFPKERLEVFCSGRVLQLDNFRILKGYGWKGFKKMKLWHQDKGHTAEVASFLNAIKNGDPSPIPFNEIEEITRITFEIAAQS
jgi:predicted dehydrogenase/threonine dehydrogenase-like Zn-dependent dehydrogenase